ncbi:MAG: alpha/beta fold hydrolase [Kiloniellales bacterium]
MTQPLALLPGLLCDAALWRHQVDALADLADCQVADFTSQDSVAAMAESVLAMMPERFALAGLSMGGYVALEVMRQAPGRVTRLALLDTSAWPDTPEQTARRRGLIELAETGKFKGVTPRLLPLLIHESRLDDADLTGVVLAMAERVGKDAFLGQQRAIMERPDSRPTLVTIRCPTLVICGRQDALTPLDRAMELAAGISDARLLVAEDCGHLSALERPETVNQALKAWLN